MGFDENMGFDDSDAAVLDRAFGVFQMLPAQLPAREHTKTEYKLYTALILDALRVIRRYHHGNEKYRKLAIEDYQWLMNDNHGPFSAVTVCEELRLDIKGLRAVVKDYTKNKRTLKMPRRSPVTRTSVMSKNFERRRRKRRRNSTSRVSLPSVA